MKGYSAAALARELGINYHTVLRWIKAGHITAVCLPSGRFMISRAECDRLKQMLLGEPE